jgi:hypothetical protein
VSWPLLAKAYPQACRNICGWALNENPASMPARSTIRAKPAVVNGRDVLCDLGADLIRQAQLEWPPHCGPPVL